MRDITEYCAFNKAIEHLGDRWALFIVRELAVAGPRGFNALADAMPGRISRSILSDRLRRLEDLGLVARGAGRYASYRLTDAGSGLLPTFLTLRAWADTWMPEDPDMALRDPAVVLSWLGHRVNGGGLPEQPAVLEITIRRDPLYRGWLVLQRGAEPYGCEEDPMLADSRYVYLEAAPATIVSLGHGRRSVGEALADGSLAADGDRALLADLSRWFLPAAEQAQARRAG